MFYGGRQSTTHTSGCVLLTTAKVFLIQDNLFFNVHNVVKGSVGSVNYLHTLANVIKILSKFSTITNDAPIAICSFRRQKDVII